MQFKQTIVLFAVAAFAAFSCISVDKSVGEDFIPGNQNIKVHTISLDLPVRTRSVDTLYGLSNAYSIVGSIRTPEYGLAEFASVADICPTSSGWSFGKDAQVLDCYLNLRNSQSVFLEENQAGIPQTITLHRTLKQVDSNSVFNTSFTENDYESEPLNLTEDIFFGGDSIRIKIRKSYAEELMTATEKELDSLHLFVERFKGILIKSSLPEDGADGGRQNLFEFGSGSLNIKVNFQPTWKEGLERKDTLFRFSYGYGSALNLSSYQTRGTEKAEATEYLPIEGCAGLKPFIGHEDLKDIIDAWKKEIGAEGKKIVIAKATLSFPFEIPEDYDMKSYPANLYPCHEVKEKENAGRRFMTLFNDVSVEGYALGELNRSLCEYRMDIPSLVQEMVSKDKSELDESYDIWIMPIYSQTDQYGNVSYHIQAYDYYVGRLNGLLKGKSPKLDLVYSIVE